MHVFPFLLSILFSWLLFSSVTAQAQSSEKQSPQPASFKEISTIFHQAFVLKGQADVASLVAPPGTLDDDLARLFQHRPINVKLYPPTEEDIGSNQTSNGHDWPHRPIAKLYVQTNGPKGKDFTDVWFTVGLHNGKPVLMAKSYQGIPEWRR